MVIKLIQVLQWGIGIVRFGNWLKTALFHQFGGVCTLLFFDLLP
jgi:hypothetical protein